jgi:uncharacterized membrane protein
MVDWSDDKRPAPPLRGCDRLTAADVGVLLRPAFWLRRWVPDKEIFAKRQVTVIGLHALAGLKAPRIVRLRIDDCDLVERQIRMRVGGRERWLAITPLLAHLLGEWIAVRPASATDALFVSRGGALSMNGIERAMQSASQVLGAEPGLAELLVRFFKENLARDADGEAVYVRLGRRVRSRGGETISPARLRALVLRTDPFKGKLRFFANAVVPRTGASAPGTSLPASYDACFAPGKFAVKRKPDLPPDHPLVAELAAVAWPTGRTNRIRLRKAILARHGDELHRLIDAGRLSLRQAAGLLTVTVGTVNKLRSARSPAVGPRAKAKTSSAHSAPALSPEERERLARIRGAEWPAAADQPAFRRVLLKTHYGFVFGLLEQHKLPVADAAALFRLSTRTHSELRSDFRAGVFQHAVSPPPRNPNFEYWRGVVLRELSHRPPGQGDADFCRMLRKKYGLPLSSAWVGSLVYRARHPRAAAPLRRPKPRRPECTPRERARLARLRRLIWPAATDPRAFRRALIKEHFGFVFRLLDERKLTMAEAARLFRCPAYLMKELRSDFRTGSFDYAVAAPVPPNERAYWHALVLRELPRRPAEETPHEFFRNLRRRYGFPLPFASVQRILAAGRKKEPESATFRFGVSRRLKPALTPDEKARLRIIVGAPWAETRDPAGLRRSLLRDHFGFVHGLLRKWKLNDLAAARLFRIGVCRLRVLRADFEDGAFEQAIGPRLPAPEQARWRALVIRALPSRRRGECARSFCRRLRREFGLPLAYAAVKRILAAEERCSSPAAADRRRRGVRQLGIGPPNDVLETNEPEQYRNGMQGE